MMLRASTAAVIGRAFDDLRQDARDAWRGCVREPGFTAVVILTLALGIGVNASIFQLMDAVRLRSLYPRWRSSCRSRR